MNDPSSAWADYGPQSEESEEDSTIFSQSRMYIPEPGWRIGVKIGSTREFCYNRRLARTTITASSTARFSSTAPKRSCAWRVHTDVD